MVAIYRQNRPPSRPVHASPALAALADAATVLERDPSATVREVAAGLRSYLAGDSECLDAALGLAPPDSAADRLRRDAMMRAAVEVFWPDSRAAAQSRALRAALSRYHAGAWRWERREEQCPPHRAGTIESFCWEILKAVPAVPSDRTVRRILAIA